MGHCNGWERERERAGESQMRVIDLSNKRRENSKVGFGLKVETALLPTMEVKYVWFLTK